MDRQDRPLAQAALFAQGLGRSRAAAPCGCELRPAFGAGWRRFKGLERLLDAGLGAERRLALDVAHAAGVAQCQGPSRAIAPSRGDLRPAAAAGLVAEMPCTACKCSQPNETHDRLLLYADMTSHRALPVASRQVGVCKLHSRPSM